MKRIEGNTVEFEDGKKACFDAIIFATGYRSTVRNWLKVLTDRFHLGKRPWNISIDLGKIHLAVTPCLKLREATTCSTPRGCPESAFRTTGKERMVCTAPGSRRGAWLGYQGMP